MKKLITINRGMVVPKLNDYFYLVSNEVVSLHKINYLTDTGKFEWGKIYKTHMGWGEVDELQPNTSKSKVKWIKCED